MRRRLTTGLALLIIGFLLGFIPQYVKSREISLQLSDQNKQLADCRLSEQMSKLRDSAAMVYLHATQKNYGIAAEQARQMFDQAQRLASQTEDPALRKVAGDVLAARDAITADLANGDAAVVGKLQPLLIALEQTARH
ncbi:MAG TPA: hypothetical protein VH744_10815 [Terriglobales bacterium]|jgi:hypothetical protein